MYRNHMLLMFLCCLIPLAILGGLFVLGVAISTLLIIAALIFCLIVHSVVMFAVLNRHNKQEIDFSNIPSSK